MTLKFEEDMFTEIVRIVYSPGLAVFELTIDEANHWVQAKNYFQWAVPEAQSGVISVAHPADRQVSVPIVFPPTAAMLNYYAYWLEYGHTYDVDGLTYRAVRLFVNFRKINKLITALHLSATLPANPGTIDGFSTFCDAAIYRQPTKLTNKNPGSERKISIKGEATSILEGKTGFLGKVFGVRRTTEASFDVKNRRVLGVTVRNT